MSLPRPQQSATSGSLPRYAVDLEPPGKRTHVPAGTTLLEAAQLSGVDLVATCGGIGVCDSCRVQLIAGVLSETTANELDELSVRELDEGFRLACQAEVFSDVRVEIPADSLAAPQRLHLEGRHSAVPFAPSVKSLLVNVPPPALSDLRADDRRIRDALERQGATVRDMTRPALVEASARLREHNWSARLAVQDDVVVAALPPDARPLALAFDMGTTKIAGYLIELGNGDVIARAGATNPQIAFGEDVISRISYVNEHETGGALLQARLVEALNDLAGRLCAEQHTPADHVVEIVAVGNTAMQHLLAGLPVAQLGESPYVPVNTAPLTVRAADLGLNAAPASYLYLPANVAGFVGSDHVAMVLASNAHGSADAKQVTLYVDIGTNTEISLVTQDQTLTCSCASGPAFEGAHIRHGMRAAPGAIEHVRWHEGQFQLHTIGDTSAIGICGSGILDAVASLRKANLIDPLGRFRDGSTEFVLVDSAATAHGADIVITRSDINEIQLAKSAIRTGINLLIEEADLRSTDIDRIVVAGAFGTYLRVESAIAIGLFPNIPIERFDQVGNAAGMGAIDMVRSAEQRELATRLAQQMTYIELTDHCGFHNAFLDALLLQADAE